jgi:hypothetical protein
MNHSRNRPVLVALAAAALLSGCGLAETGAVAAGQGGSAAEQAKQAKETQAKVEKQIEEAQKAAAAQRDAAENIGE